MPSIAISELRAVVTAAEPGLGIRPWDQHWADAENAVWVHERPVGHTLRWLSNPLVPALLRTDEDRLDHAIKVLRALDIRTARAGQGAREDLALGGRRWITAVLHDSMYRDREALEGAVATHGLPRPVLRANGALLHPLSWDPRSETTIRSFIRSLDMLEGVAEIPCETLMRAAHESNADYIFRILAAQVGGHRFLWESVRVGVAVLREIASVDVESMDLETCRAVVGLGIELYFGIPKDQVAQIGVLTSGAFASLLPDRVELKIGTGYFRDDLCFAEATDVVPLSPELARLAERICAAGPRPRLFAGMGHRAVVLRRRFLERAMTNDGIREAEIPRSLHGVLPLLCIEDLGILPTVIGRVIARPLSGSRGECAYLRANGGELCDARMRAMNALRHRAEFAEWQPTAPMEVRTNAANLDLDHWFRALAERVDRSATWNEIMLVKREFLEATMGMRPRRSHEHPGIWLRQNPVPCLALEDKEVSGERRMRFVPLLAPVLQVIEAAVVVLPPCREVPYQCGSEWREFGDLSEATIRQMNVAWRRVDPLNSGRVVYYNALRITGAEQSELNALMGHGPSACQPHSVGSTEPLLHQLDRNRAALGRMYERFGIPAIADRLAAKIRSLRQMSHEVLLSEVGAEANKIAPIRGLDTGHVDTRRPDLAIAIMSRGDHLQLAQLRTAICAANSGHRLLVDWMILMATEIGVPPGHFEKRRKDYDHDCIRVVGSGCDEGQYVFCGLLEQEDAGGLSCHLMPIDRGEAGGRAAIELLRAMRKRKRVGSSATLLVPEDVGVLRRKIGARVARLLSPGKTRPDMSNHEAYVLLERIATNVAVWRYGGMIAGALAGVPIGINHADPHDVAEQLFGSRVLRSLDGEPWEPDWDDPDETRSGMERFRRMLVPLLPNGSRGRGRPMRLPAVCLKRHDLGRWSPADWFELLKGHPVAKNRGRLEEMFVEAGLKDRAAEMARAVSLQAADDELSEFTRSVDWRKLYFRRWNADEWWALLQLCFQRPSLDGFETALRVAGLGVRASTMAQAVYRLATEGGALRLSRPFRAIALDWRELRERVADEAIQTGFTEEESWETSDFALTLFACEFRPAEAYALGVGGVHCQGDDVLLRIRRGKTKSAARTVSLLSMCHDHDLYLHLLERLRGRCAKRSKGEPVSLWPTLARRMKRWTPDGVVLDGRRFQAIFRAILREAVGLKPYDLRHIGCLLRLRKCAEEHPAPWYGYATQSAQMGHVGAHLQWYTYAGTGMCTVFARRRRGRRQAA